MWKFVCRSPAALSALAVALVTLGCNGGGGGSSPTAPSPPSGGGGGTAITIGIAGDRGNQSFTPNPASAEVGAMVVWRNNDSVVHRVRFNDGSLDTQDILPGQTSAPRAMPTDGANYHCPLHPGMVGSINSAGGAPPDCDDPLYC